MQPRVRSSMGSIRARALQISRLASRIPRLIFANAANLDVANAVTIGDSASTELNVANAGLLEWHPELRQ